MEDLSMQVSAVYSLLIAVASCLSLLVLLPACAFCKTKKRKKPLSPEAPKPPEQELRPPTDLPASEVAPPVQPASTAITPPPKDSTKEAVSANNSQPNKCVGDKERSMKTLQPTEESVVNDGITKEAHRETVPPTTDGQPGLKDEPEPSEDAHLIEKKKMGEHADSDEEDFGAEIPGSATKGNDDMNQFCNYENEEEGIDNKYSVEDSNEDNGHNSEDDGWESEDPVDGDHIISEKTPDALNCLQHQDVVQQAPYYPRQPVCKHGTRPSQSAVALDHETPAGGSRMSGDGGHLPCSKASKMREPWKGWNQAMPEPARKASPPAPPRRTGPKRKAPPVPTRRAPPPPAKAMKRSSVPPRATDKKTSSEMSPNKQTSKANVHRPTRLLPKSKATVKRKAPLPPPRPLAMKPTPLASPRRPPPTNHGTGMKKRATPKQPGGRSSSGGGKSKAPKRSPAKIKHAGKKPETTEKFRSGKSKMGTKRGQGRRKGPGRAS